jgi:putative ABC transport system permease protein
MTTGSGLIVDEGYIECMDMEIVTGRSFSEEFMDTLSVIVNEAAIAEMELIDPIGKSITSNDQFLNPNPNEPSVYKIVGVVKDFHFQSLHQVISPLFLIHNQRSFTPGVDGLITVRMNPPNFQETISNIEGLWQKFQPEQPFNYAFLDNDWAKLYEKEMDSRRVLSVFSIIAIFIACMGLLGLAAYITQQRTKEIGIRKVLGATTENIVTLLSKDFLKLVAIALVVASPIAWWFGQKWLSDFAYRIEIDWWIFAFAGLLAVAIAFFTVSYQSIRAALANPINSLKDE